MIHIRQAFEGLREDNDGTSSNEVRLSKLKIFPFFTKQDLARLPGGSAASGSEACNDSFTLHNPVIPQMREVDDNTLQSVRNEEGYQEQENRQGKWTQVIRKLFIREHFQGNTQATDYFWVPLRESLTYRLSE